MTKKDIKVNKNVKPQKSKKESDKLDNMTASNDAPTLSDSFINGLSNKEPKTAANRKNTSKEPYHSHHSPWSEAAEEKLSDTLASPESTLSESVKDFIGSEKAFSLSKPKAKELFPDMTSRQRDDLLGDAVEVFTEKVTDDKNSYYDQKLASMILEEQKPKKDLTKTEKFLSYLDTFSESETLKHLKKRSSKLLEKASKKVASYPFPLEGIENNHYLSSIKDQPIAKKSLEKIKLAETSWKKWQEKLKK